MDDILVSSIDKEEHLKHLRILFQRLISYGIVVNMAKCVFGVPDVKYGFSACLFFGHLVNADGVRPSPEKVEAEHHQGVTSVP